VQLGWDGAPVSGKVVLVGTPIGNLGDLSPRARAALGAADVIFCEDTRRTRKLLSAADVPAPRLVNMHDHNEAAAADYAVSLAIAGSDVAVVTDAGMPGISDPGERVVAAAHQAGIDVEVVPGPSAAVAALVASGLPAGRFCFEGFLPRKGAERAARLRQLGTETRTSVIFESPHRARRTFADLVGACGPERPVAVARELTKLHEEVWRTTLGQALERAESSEPRGEWVIVLAGAPAAAADLAGEEGLSVALRQRLASGDDRRQAVAAVAAELGVPKRAVYQASLALPHEAAEPGADG
jgi:16S rRNA (cytidine1402-2'-O)-methyltransferase